MADKPTIVVLISGSGTNLQALIDAVENKSLNATIAAVVSNRKAAYGLERAKKAHIPTHTISLKQKNVEDKAKARKEFEIKVAEKILCYKPDLVVLAGWMHILSSDFLGHFNNNIINLHPALPNQYNGAHAIERAFKEFSVGKTKHTGVMVHEVIAEVDQGKVIVQRKVPFEENDTLKRVEERIHRVEHELIVEGARTFLNSLPRISLDEKK